MLYTTTKRKGTRTCLGNAIELNIYFKKPNAFKWIFGFFVIMSVFFASLNSGSNGNCFYIGNAQEGILIDAGLSCKETEKRLAALSISIRSIKAIFISHEHIDHIKGVEVLSKKYEIPVFITPATLSNSHTPIPEKHIRKLAVLQPESIGELEVTAFPKWHDAADPTSFIIRSKGFTIGVFTDIGAVCEQVKFHFSQCHVAFLEANYDDEMLENGPYPYLLKKRIQSDKGHLSNAQALALFNESRPPHLSHLFLAHLSKENNDPDLVHGVFSAVANQTEIIIASRYGPTKLYALSSSDKKKSAPNVLVQMSMFD